MFRGYALNPKLYIGNSACACVCVCVCMFLFVGSTVSIIGVTVPSRFGLQDWQIRVYFYSGSNSNELRVEVSRHRQQDWKIVFLRRPIEL